GEGQGRRDRHGRAGRDPCQRRSEARLSRGGARRMNAVAKPEVLVLITLVEPWHGELEREFTLRYVARAADRAAAIREHAPGIRAIITNGTIGTSRELIGELPRLEIIACFSAGLRNLGPAA